MINHLILKQEERFVAKLTFTFSAPQRTEQIEFAHTPWVDPVKTYAADGAGEVHVTGEIVDHDGKGFAFGLTCQRGPLFAAADGAGLKIFTMKQ